MKRAGAALARLRESRALSLAGALGLLSLCVLLIVDVVGLRNDGSSARQDAREALAESLAMQLSALDGVSDTEDLASVVERFVREKRDVLGAEILETNGNSYIRFGAAEVDAVGWPATSSDSIRIPVSRAGSEFAEIKLAFAQVHPTREDVIYFTAVVLGVMITNAAFLAKALLQIDPARAVPAKVKSAFNILAEGVLVLDTRYRIMMANESALSILDESRERLIGRNIESCRWLRDPEWQAPWHTVMNTGLSVNDHPVRLESASDRLYSANCTLISDEAGDTTGIMITLDDITAIERKNRELSGTLTRLRQSQAIITEKNRELEALALRDPLTGLYNRRSLLAELESCMTKARTSASILACIMVDIDHFKSINDTHGHATGDEVICAVANTLRTTSRAIDTVGRIGGEEFVVVLPDCESDEPQLIAERLRASIEALSDDVTVPVNRLSASLGVVTLDESIRSVGEMLERADAALYEAKNGGRNRVVLYDSDNSTDLMTATRSSSPIERQDLRVGKGTTAEADRSHNPESPMAASVTALQSHDFDKTTQLPRRSMFLPQVSTALDDAARRSEPIGILSLSVKDFERLSATLDHDTSERLLCAFCDRVRDTLRNVDMAREIAPGHPLAHLRDNEFGVLLDRNVSSRRASELGESLRIALAAPFEITSVPIYAGVNIGIATTSRQGKDPETLIGVATKARARAAALPERASLCLSGETPETSDEGELAFEADLYQAVADESFELRYQPQFDVTSQRITGVEALIRWLHPSRGWVSPAEFIPKAEKNGLIDPISDFVMRKALKQLHRWHMAGHDDVSLSVNISGVQLRNPALVGNILTAIERQGVAPQRVDVELTETAIIDSPQRARVALAQLGQAGLKISMDDFGTGYTSLALLADLPLHIVKIDRSFINAMQNSERSRAIVESIVSMAHALKLSVVGEGVENNEQLETLASLGCEVVQGYLISKPLDAEEILDFLNRQREGRERRRAA